MIAKRLLQRYYPMPNTRLTLRCRGRLRKAGRCLLGLSLLIAVFITYLVLFNVHLSPLYVRYRSMLYPATFNITGECPWNRESNPHNFTANRVFTLTTLAHLFEELYLKYGIKTVLRGGALIHIYRHIVADGDMDVWMIVPRHMTFSQVYGKIEETLRGDSLYQNLHFVRYNSLVMSLVLEYNDWMYIEFDGNADIVVLHETFINDPGLQTPCLTAFDCNRPQGDREFEENHHRLRTDVIFHNLCRCRYWDSTLFCLTDSELFLRTVFGNDFMVPFTGLKKDYHQPREMVYERCLGYIRLILRLFPQLKNIRL